MNCTLPSEPQVSLPALPSAAPGNTGDQCCCLLSLLKAGMGGGKKELRTLQKHWQAPCSSPDHPLACPLKARGRATGQPGSSAQVPAVTLTCNIQYLWLIPGTLIQHSYTTLAVPGSPGAGLPPRREALCPEEGRDAGRPGDGVGACPGPRMQRGAGEDAEGDSRAHRVCNGAQGKAPARSDRTPPGWQPLTLCPGTSYGTFVFLGGYLGLGVMNASPEHFVPQTPSTKVALTFNFILSEKSEEATLHQEKWQGSLQAVLTPKWTFKFVSIFNISIFNSKVKLVFSSRITQRILY